MARRRGILGGVASALLGLLLLTASCSGPDGEARRDGVAPEGANTETAGSAMERTPPSGEGEGILELSTEQEWPPADANAADIERVLESAGEREQPVEEGRAGEAVEAVAGPRRPQAAEAEVAERGPAVTLSLTFVPGQVTMYTVTTETQKSVAWEGSPSTKPAAFKGGHTGNHIEMTFGHRVESVDPDGVAMIQITITALKYLGRVQDKVVLDFDSSRETDRDSALARLIGQSYRIGLSPKGEVVKVMDAEAARSVAKGDSAADKTASRLLRDDEIRQRHSVAALAALESDEVRPGQQWSDIKPFSFGMMGSKSYERVYTLMEVTDGRDGQAAIVEMKAIPSSAMAEELHKQETANPFSRMFDSTDNYHGRLELELGGGGIREYVEELRTEWVVADPAAIQGDAEPAALRMTATQLHRLERVE